jgi:hypothetical protein
MTYLTCVCRNICESVVCPKDMVNPEECLAYKDGYSDEAMDQLE